MQRKILDSGTYVMYENDYGRRIIILNNRHWYVWTKGNFGPALNYSDPRPFIGGVDGDYVMRMQGKYFLIDLHKDRLMPHLFLQDDTIYLELVLPNGLPTANELNKAMIVSDRIVPREWVENYDEFMVFAHKAE